MAVVTRFHGSGTELNSPWPEIMPSALSDNYYDLLANALLGTLGAGVTVANGFKVLRRHEADDDTTTLSEGSTAADVDMMLYRYATNSLSYGFAIIYGVAFTDYDETTQDKTLSTTLSVEVGGTTFAISESDTGVAFDSDVLTVSGSDYFTLKFTDSRDEDSNVLRRLFTRLEGM